MAQDREALDPENVGQGHDHTRAPAQRPDRVGDGRASPEPGKVDTHDAEGGEELRRQVAEVADGSGDTVDRDQDGGVRAMMRSLAVEWATYGIRLNAVAPGPFPTEGAFSRLMPGSEMEKQARRRIPSRRFGEHWELTNLVAYLMSDASPYQTGDLVTIDGAEALFAGQQFAGFAHLDRAAAKELMASLKPKR